jgi:hypothetical protein
MSVDVHDDGRSIAPLLPTRTIDVAGEWIRAANLSDPVSQTILGRHTTAPSIDSLARHRRSSFFPAARCSRAADCDGRRVTPEPQIIE